MTGNLSFKKYSPEMKESLNILGIKSSGLEEIKKIALKKRNDDEVFTEIEQITNPEERENYLRKLLEKKPHGFVKSKLLLAEQIKNKDLKYAFDLIMSATLSAPTEVECYFLLAQIAFENKAWLLAYNSCEIVRWLYSANKNDKKETFTKTEDLIIKIKERIRTKEYDSSQNEFWVNKNPDKFWILEKLYFQSKIKELTDLCFKLLDLFPDDIKNYEVIYKALALVDKRELFKKFIDSIEKNLKNDHLHQNLFLGMVHYHFLEFLTSITYLQNALKANPTNSKCLFYLALNYLMTNNVKDFIKTSEIILPESDTAFIALYFIFSAASNVELEKSEFPNHKNIARETSLILEKLLKCGQAEAVAVIENKFKKLNYNLILPYWQLYLAEVYIKQNLLEKAKDVLNGCTDSDVHRLNSWIYRLEGKEDLAETELLKYRQSWKVETDSGFYCQMVNLQLPEKSPDNIEEIFKHLKSAYTQVKEITRQIEMEYGLNTMTCIETGCQDCCTKTFPQLTYTEYLYMRDWIEKQPEDFKNKIQNESIKVINLYRERFKKDPPFMPGDTTFSKHYPLDFVFDCPCLGDNKCNVYEGRPFGCRGYGYSSYDGITFKGCNYFYEQFRSATKLNHIRKVVSAVSFFNFIRLVDEKLIGQKVMAPIPVWFAQNHEETIRKVKEAVSNSQTMALHP